MISYHKFTLFDERHLQACPWNPPCRLSRECGHGIDRLQIWRRFHENEAVRWQPLLWADSLTFPFTRHGRGDGFFVLVSLFLVAQNARRLLRWNFRLAEGWSMAFRGESRAEKTPKCVGTLSTCDYCESARTVLRSHDLQNSTFDFVLGYNCYAYVLPNRV